MRTKMTFAQILQRVHRQNLVALKDRAFAANRIAKLTFGRSRRAAYSVKDKSISRLLTFGEARILRLYGRPTGVRFRSGGQLHLRTAKELATKPAVYADS
ncbi:MAG: hypothetical protein M1404_01265 [Acidobacteria bacterium]|nr:hypothetical protein [Acidobacteriota bacterium]